MKDLAIIKVLRVPAFRSLWLAQFFSQIGINLLTFVLALRVYDLTHKNTIVSMLAISFIVPQALFGSFAGVLVDRYDKKVVLFLCNIVRAFLVLGFLLSSESIGFVYLLGIAISIATQFFVPAEAPIIPDLVSKKDLVTANGVFTLTIFIAMLGGGVLAGPFLDLFKLNGTFLIIFGMYFLAAFFVTRIPGQGVIPAIRRNLSNSSNWANLFGDGSLERFKMEFEEGRRYILGNRKILTALLLLVGSQTVIASFSTLLPGFADTVLHLPINDASVLLLGPAILGIVIGAALISQIGARIKLKFSINAGVILVSLFLFLLGFATSRTAAQLLLLLLGFANALIDVSSNTILQRETTEEVRSRVYGVLTSLGGIVFFLPVFLSGAISDLFGVSKMFLFGGLLILLIWVVKIRKENI